MKRTEEQQLIADIATIKEKVTVLPIMHDSIGRNTRFRYYMTAFIIITVGLTAFLLNVSRLNNSIAKQPITRIK